MQKFSFRAAGGTLYNNKIKYNSNIKCPRKMEMERMQFIC